MNNRTLPIILGTAAIFLVGGVIFLSSRLSTSVSPVDTTQDETQISTSTTETGNTGTQTSTTTTGGGQASVPPTYTLAQVSTHKNTSSCWSAINGNVYDLTNWISQHPGGEGAILSICGVDGSSAFNAQHGGAKRQADILATFKIGALAK